MSVVLNNTQERVDALWFVRQANTFEVVPFDVLRTIPGVVITHVAGENGVGTGTLRATGDGTLLSWRAPGSSTFGASVWVGGAVEHTSGTAPAYALEDGENLDAYIRVGIYSQFLTAGAASSKVYLVGNYNNEIGNDDVTAAEATAGDVASYAFRISNKDTDTTLTRLRVWLDAANSSGLKISDDDATWVNPTTEAAALELPDLAPSSLDTVYIQRTISAGAIADPEVLNVLHLSHEGI